MSCLLYFFADDTTVYVQNDSIDTAIEILNTELATTLWFDSNKLTLIVNKTQMIMLSRKKKFWLPKMKLSYEMKSWNE